MELSSRIAVGLADLVPGVFLLAEQFVEFGEVENDVPGEDAELAHRHLVGGVRQAVGIAEGRFRQAKLTGALGHEVGGENPFVARHGFGQRNAGVVAALDDRPVQEIVDRDLAIDRGEHGRAAGGCAAPAPGVLANPVFVGQLDVALLDGVEDDLRGHQLHHAGGRAQFVGVLLEQHAAAGGLDQDRSRGVAVEAGIICFLGALDALVGRVERPAPADGRDHRRRDQPTRQRSGGEPGAPKRGKTKFHGQALRAAF
ncbi:hypothetical protein ACVWWO_009671 [Bradyrhizobium sp. F1.13.1]